MVKCWMLADKVIDQRDECHREPKEFVQLDRLNNLGVKYEHIAVEGYKKPLAEFADANGYTYQDEVKVSRETLPDYEARVRHFFEEHLHKDEEIRYMLDGVGYFDVRDKNEDWIRIRCEPGDLLIFPPGIYHRFTVTHMDYVHAIRLFKGEPVWTPYNRSEETDTLPERQTYVSSVLNGVDGRKATKAGA